MKKIVLQDVQKISFIEEGIPVPGPEEAVIRVKYAGICGSDIHMFYGENPNARLPLVMGHEVMGTLHALNSNRSDIQIGDKVCVHTVLSCQSCAACMSGHENLCEHVRIMGTNLDGVYTQYLLVRANKVIRFHDEVDDRVAALVEPLTVAVHDTRSAGVEAGDRVFIAGCGPIGLIIAIMCRHAGASEIVMSEIEPVRIRMAEEMGFRAINPMEKEFDRICEELTDGAGFDKAFEITSTQSAFDACIKHLKKGGVHLQVGMPRKGTRYSLDADKLIYSECRVVGVRHHTMQDMLRAANLINTGVLDKELAAFVSAVYPMENAMEAFQRAKDDKSVLRVLLDFQ